MSGAPDVSKLSDAELMALISGSPPDPAPNAAPPVQPVDVQPLAPPPGLNSHGQPFDPNASTPTAGQKALSGLGNGVASFADGIPVLGAYADEADAAAAAAAAPVMEPMMRHAPHLVQALLGYDQRAEIGDIPTFRGRYGAAKNIQRFNADQFHDEHPVLDTSLKIGGGVAGGVAMLPFLGAATTAAGPEAGLLTRAAAGAVEGGGIGAVDGYGRGQGGLTDASRVHGAEMGGLIGAGAGGALPVVSQVARTAYGNTVGRVVDAARGPATVQAPATEEAARIAKILRGMDGEAAPPTATPPTGGMVRRYQGVDYPVEVLGQREVDGYGVAHIKVRGADGAVGFVPEAEVVPGKARAPQALPGDSSTGAPTEPRASAMKPDRGDLESALVAAQRSPLTTRASNVDDAYIRIARAAERQKMTPQEMADAAKDVGPFGTLADSGESARDLLRAAVNRPGRGATIAEENLTPRQNGVFDPETGSWPVRPSSTRITDQAQAGLGLEGKDFHSEIDALLASRKAAAGPAYAKAYSAPGVDIGELRDFAGTKLFRDAYDRARAISEKEFIKLADGTEGIQPLPEKFSSNDTLDWRSLDLMKQGLDDLVKEGKVQGIGANDQGATKGYLSRFVAKLDSINPDYKVAREAFAGPTAMKDAIEEGRTLLSEDAPLVAANIAGRPESERQMLRLGALQALQTKLGNANVTFDAANQAGLLKPNQLARFKALFPDAKSFADFYRTMQSEKTMFSTNKAAFGNSTSAKQLLNVMEPSDPQIEGVGQVAAAAGTGNVIGLIKALHRMGMESPMREDTAATIASVLSSHDAENLPMIVKRMTEAQRAAALADVLRQSNGAITGTAASRTVQRGQ